MARIFGVGLMCVDHIFLSPSRRIRQKNLEYLGSSGGGSVGNTLCMLSVLGHRTQAFGVIGNDQTGVLIKHDLSTFEVDAKRLVMRGGLKDLRQSRQFCHIIYPDGKHTNKTVCPKCGVPFRREIQFGEDDLCSEVVDNSRHSDLIHIDRANKGSVGLAGACREGGGMVAFDYTYDTRQQGSRWINEILATSDMVKVSEGVFKKRMGEISSESLALWQEQFPNMKFLFVTRADSGVVGFGSLRTGKRLRFDREAIACEHLRDSAGAGDIFTAAAISEILLRAGSIQDPEELNHRIDVCQSLASLSCTVYGARTLQRFLRAGRLSRKEILENAETVVKLGKVGNSISPKLGLPPPLSQPFRFEPSASCGICGSYRGTRERPKRSIRPDFISNELGKSPPAMNHAYEMGMTARKTQMGKYLSEARERPIILVGSGGSLVAASFGEQLVLRSLGLPGKAIAPFEFTNLPAMDARTGVVLLSYGGENSDILAAAERVVELGMERVIVVTGSPSSKLAKLAKKNKWAVVELLREVRGFVATAGMLSMVSALASILTPDGVASELSSWFSLDSLYKTFSDAEKRAVSEVRKFPEGQSIASRHLIALGSGWGWPAATDLESKVVEAGVCTIEISELKNFTHGRYISAFHHSRNRDFILFGTPDDSELVDYLVSKLKRYFNIAVFDTPHEGIRGSLDLLVQELYFAHHLTKRAGKSLTSPKYPPQARGLYGWQPQRKNG